MTILQALENEVHYPLKQVTLELNLLKRGLDGEGDMTRELSNSPEFKGTVADCLISLITAPNFSESDISYSLPNKDLIIERANALYEEIGEEDKCIGKPKVFIGG